MTPMAMYPEIPLIQHIASPDESLEQPPFQGNLYSSRSSFTVIDLCGAGEYWRRTTIEVLPEDVLLEIFDFYRMYAGQSPGRP